MSELLSEDSSKVSRLDTKPLESRCSLEGCPSTWCTASGEVGEGRLEGLDMRLTGGERGGVGGGVGGPSVSHGK